MSQKEVIFVVVTEANKIKQLEKEEF